MQHGCDLHFYQRQMQMATAKLNKNAKQSRQRPISPAASRKRRLARVFLFLAGSCLRQVNNISHSKLALRLTFFALSLSHTQTIWWCGAGAGPPPPRDQSLPL
jgi:hypothetical protein